MKLGENAPPTKPSKPYLTDDHQPTDPSLWEKVLEVARGRRREFTRNERTIHAPNEGRGFRHWPNPKAVAWAVKQYNGFNGGWKGASLLFQASSGILATQQGSDDHATALQFSEAGLVHLASAQNGWHYWNVTFKGARQIRASLADELQHKMHDLLHNFDVQKSWATGAWIADKFRVKSPKTPKGGKELKEKMLSLVWTLENRISQYSKPGSPEQSPESVESLRQEVADKWKDLEHQVPQIVAGFTDEGGKVVPKELLVDGVTFINEVGLDEASAMKYVKRLTTIFNSVKGWRAKALAGNMKVVLASPRLFSGTATGKYKSAEDAMLVRTTPAVLKRDGGYGSFEYVIVHELGHRYEYKNRVPEDFDKPEWHTSRYSMKEGESFAELFALGFFNYTGAWDKTRVERFNTLMGGGS